MRGLACNCPQSGIDVGGTNTRLGRFSQAPSWYDNIYNAVSSDAENLWNDAESAGVWAYNQVEGFAQSTFPGTAGPPQNSQQAQQRQAELGPLAPILGPLDKLDPSSPNYDPSLWEWILVGGGIILLVALSPTINRVATGR